ncbi:V8-like Glu-specific endopeptidase [Bradyrhizobium sp. USDA 4472]
MSQWDYQALAQLNEILANLYPLDSDARRIATKVGLRTAFITFESKAISTWFNILQYAKPQGKTDAIVDAALEEFPGDESLKRAKEGRPPPTIKGPEATDWNGPQASGLEKIIGQKSTLVPINYLQIGLTRSKSVVRVKREDGSSGSGFVTEANVLITNNHVLPTKDSARGAVVQFNYQQTVDGLDAKIEEVGLLPETLRTLVADDWTAVTLEGDPVSRWGALVLKRKTLAVGDHVNIVQHPGGGPKQISLFSNVVVFAGNGRVQYLTDTLPGSSGSPVFDSAWDVVALHHSGGWLTEPNSGSKTTYYRNEGISIDRILDGLSASS